MFKKLFLFSFLFLSFLGFIYPTKKENTKILDYCHSLEKILSRNISQNRGNVSNKVKSIAKGFGNFGVSNTKGAFIKKMIKKYKTSKNSFIVVFIPNEIYCLTGYWIEEIRPGTFELIFYEKSKQKINELKDIKNEFNGLIKDINLEYKNIKKEFDSFF